MDPLSDVLSLLKLRAYGCGGLDVAAPFSIGFPRHEGIKCYAVVSGEGWLVVEGVAEPMRLRAGDGFLLLKGLPFRLATDLDLTPLDWREALRAPLNGEVLTYNGGGDCFAVGGHFLLDGGHAEMLLGMLPPVVHLREARDKAALRWSVERMMQELRDPQPGGMLVAQHLAHMMLVQALRLHLADGPKGRVGWLFALSDRRIRAAIGALHATPARRWTLQVLAEQAGMSRSTFALRFKETVGESPMEYLTRWRMLLAADRLTGAAEAVSVIALSLGYESESAFSTAFKRVMGVSPRQYGRGKAAEPPAPAFEPARAA